MTHIQKHPFRNVLGGLLWSLPFGLLAAAVCGLMFDFSVAWTATLAAIGILITWSMIVLAEL